MTNQYAKHVAVSEDGFGNLDIINCDPERVGDESEVLYWIHDDGSVQAIVAKTFEEYLFHEWGPSLGVA